MEKNKSIDGLSSKRSKRTAPVSPASVPSIKSASQKPTRAKTVKKPTTRTTTTRKTTAKPVARTTTRKPVAKKPVTRKTATKRVVAPAPVAKTSIARNPVSASTLSQRTARPSTRRQMMSQPVLHSSAKPPVSEQSTSRPVHEPQLTSHEDAAEDFLKPVQAFDFDENSGELTASKEPVNTKPKKHKKEKKRISKKRKIITSIILGVVTLLLIAVIWFIIWGNDLLAKITGGQGNIFDLFSEQYDPLKTDENGRTNILAFGTSGYDMEGTEGKGTHDGAQLTDSIMAISINQETGDIAMLSLPRDLKVSRTCTATGKINEVYWCNNTEGNDEQAGAEALSEVVSDILGVEFQYYAHLNWGSLVSIVDTLGGINITLDEDINDQYYTGSVYNAGVEYTIDGIQAVALARARHGTTSGDFSRGASQQKILMGIKNRISEKGLSITDMIGLANTLGDNLRTNFSVNELRSAAHLLSEFDFDNARQVSLIEPEKLVTTANIGGISYVIPSDGVNNYKSIQAYVAKKFSSNPRIYEDYSILILNGTDTAGIASAEETTLEQENYQNIYTDDAPDGNYTNKYTLYATTDNAPNTKKLLEEKYGTTAKSADELPALIPTNYDFIIIIGEDSSTTTE